MTCSIEMLPCDECGREVQRYYIYVKKNKKGQREFVCAECVAGEKKRIESSAERYSYPKTKSEMC